MVSLSICAGWKPLMVAGWTLWVWPFIVGFAPAYEAKSLIAGRIQLLSAISRVPPLNNLTGEAAEEVDEGGNPGLPQAGGQCSGVGRNRS